MEYFDITGFQTLRKLSMKEEFWEIEFDEKNELPNGYPQEDCKARGFMQSNHIQDFSLRGKAVYLRLKKRRWRHKESKEILKRDLKRRQLRKIPLTLIAFSNLAKKNYFSVASVNRRFL